MYFLEFYLPRVQALMKCDAIAPEGFLYLPFYVDFTDDKAVADV